MDEKSPNLIMLAIAVSLVVHMGLMLFIRPQVMTTITNAYGEPGSRGVMRLPPKTEFSDDAVRLDVVRDIEAEKDFPDAVSGDFVSASDPTVDEMSDVRTSDKIAELDVKDTQVPKLAVVPSELLSRPVTDDSNAYHPPEISPIAGKGGGFAGDVVMNHSALKADPSPLVPVEIPDVDIAMPKDLTAARINHAESVAGDVSLARPDNIAETFIPLKEVMTKVDEKIVESEKAAVRGLLDVREAKELTAFVNTIAESATQGDWTYFKVSVMPRTDLKVVPKDVVILIDASGSIANDRLKSCRENARKILRSCMNTHDRFNIVAFRDDFKYAFTTWQECSNESFERAERWMRSQTAFGRTDVFASATSVLKLPRDPKRPLIALIVTDGIANKGVRETSLILSRFTKLNDGLISVYMYGVKDEANRELIDVLTRGNRGESFIYEGRRKYAGRELEQLSDRFRDPVLTDLRVVFTSDSKAEAFPVLMKNLYKGEMVDIIGRVPKGVSEVAFSLKGLNGDKAYEGFFKYQLSKTPFNDKLPALWAAEKSIDKKLR